MCNCIDVGNTIKHIGHGIAGLSKAITGVGLASSINISNRRAICLHCDKKRLGVCTLCNCLITAKTSLKQESCPLNKWTA